MDKRLIEMLAVLAVYLLAILFIIIAFGTNYWITVSVFDTDANYGLFKGCAGGVCASVTHAGKGYMVYILYTVH